MILPSIKPQNHFNRKKINRSQYLNNENYKTIWKNTLRSKTFAQLGNSNGNIQGINKDLMINKYKISPHKIQDFLQKCYCIFNEDNPMIGLSYDKYYQSLIKLQVLVENER